MKAVAYRSWSARCSKAGAERAADHRCGGTRPGQVYAKRAPVPFGEYIPFREQLLPYIKRLEMVGRQTAPGTVPGVLRIGDVLYGDVICFEIAYDVDVMDEDGRRRPDPRGPDEQRDVRRHRAARPAVRDHLLRAVETGRDVLVASTNGISGVIHPDGAVEHKSGQGVADVYVTEVPVRTSDVTLATVLDRGRSGSPPTRPALAPYWRWCTAVAGGRTTPRRLREAVGFLTQDLQVAGAGAEKRRESDGRARQRDRTGTPSSGGSWSSSRRTTRPRTSSRSSRGCAHRCRRPTYSLPTTTLRRHRRALADKLAAADSTCTCCTARARKVSARRTSPASAGADTATASWSWTPTASPAGGAARLLDALGPRTSCSVRGTSRAARCGTGRSHREVLSRGGNIYTRLAIGVPLADATGGYRAFRRETLEGIGLDQVASAATASRSTWPGGR